MASIFSKKKKEQNAELVLKQVQENGHYDFFAALAKALLLFILVYGALGGFLSCFEIEYNKGVCMLVLFFLSLLLSMTYETGKRWLTNLLTLALFGVYCFIAMSNYWLINSGYYAIMNRVFEEARDYLSITGGVEYTTVVQDEYSTVTIFVLFLGMVGVILLNIQMQSKCSLFNVMFITFTPYVVPLYLERTPSLIYILLLLMGYTTVAVLQSSNVTERLSGQMRYVLPVSVVVLMLVARLISLVVPETSYNRMVPASSMKEDTQNAVGKFAQYGMSALLQRSSAGAGMSGGKLSKGAAAMPNYETDLLVRYTPYSYDSVYLKAFTGVWYTGDSWTEASEDGTGDARMANSVTGRKTAYEAGSPIQARGVMEVDYVGADKGYEYRPYYTDYENVVQRGTTFIYTYYPGITRGVEASEVEGYLTVPQYCFDAVAEVCNEAGFGGNPAEIAAQIEAYFDENYSYTLRPGFYYGNPDYISHFLLESKKGYCSHFASSATMLFRYMDIPARYVEGYAFSYLDVLDDGELVEGAEYKDYFDGPADLGETALIEIAVPDACAHAWVEIYIEGAGWVVVDPTPASDVDEVSTSFWDAFMNNDENVQAPEVGDNDFGAYLENALGGVSYLLCGAGVALVLILAVGTIRRMMRERALSDREKVRLAYDRLVRCLDGSNIDRSKLRTPALQLDALREKFDLDISSEQEQAIYGVFFAEEMNCDCDKLCKELISMRRSVRFKKKR